MSKILKDIQGFKYIVLELKLNELETMFSERHRAILVVEKDMRKLSGGFYEFPDLIEIQEKEKTTQYGIVQKINVETMEELLKAYISIKDRSKNIRLPPGIFKRWMDCTIWSIIGSWKFGTSHGFAIPSACLRAITSVAASRIVNSLW